MWFPCRYDGKGSRLIGDEVTSVPIDWLWKQESGEMLELFMLTQKPPKIKYR